MEFGCRFFSFTVLWNLEVLKLFKLKKHLFLLLFVFEIQNSFCQNPSILETEIYHAIDVFVANPNMETLQKLQKAEIYFNPKTQADFLAIVILNCNKGFYENQFGLTQNAILSYENAWQMYKKQKLTNYDMTASCLIPLGNLYAIIGDYSNAENTIKSYFYNASIANNAQQKYSAILNLSNVYQNTGKINEAIDLLEKSVATEKFSTSQKGILYNNLGNNYFLSTKGFLISESAFESAKNAFLTSVLLLKSDKMQTETLSNAYRNLAALSLDKNDIKTANLYFEKAKFYFEKNPKASPRKKAQFYLDSATLLFKQQKIVEANEMITSVFKILIPKFLYQKNSLPSENTLYAETVLLDAFDLQAQLFESQNLQQKALESYQLAFHIEALFQSLLVYENSKIVTQIRNRKRIEKCILIYQSLFQKEKKNDYIKKAFQLSEKSKTSVLQEYTTNKKSISKEEKAVLQQLQNWNSTILREQQKAGLADISIINNAINKQNELMLTLKLLRNKSQNNSETIKPIVIELLFEKLKKQQATFVSYFYGFEKIFVFTISNKKVTLKMIGTSETVTPKIIQLSDYFKTANAITDSVSGFNTSSNVVFEMLKLPKKGTSKNLIISPDGILNFIPFEALITQESTTTNFAKMHYLVQDFTIGYVNSANQFLDSKKLSSNKESVLGVFPIFEKTDLELAFSEIELQNLKTNYDGKYLEKNKATFDNFKQDAANYSILHLSTHAASGDGYEAASIRFYDREILYTELYNLTINPNLVVLSACETGIGKLYKAEGAMSVARGFQFAGAQNILFSLWKVNDYTTSVFMEKFYENLQNNYSYFEANHQAKLDFLADKTISNSKKSPYYWSSFVYYGTLETKESINYFFWISIGVGIVGLVVFWLFLSSRRRRNLM
jgi:CHAT domain-containing protein